MDRTPLPMFPLGSVLLPSMILPLHVFEERYRRLVDDVLAADPPEFGVALIERGSEVGGGDVRTSVGCRARVVDAQATPDGRWALTCVGSTRLRVEQWLDDDPYPRALVSDWADAPTASPSDLQGRCDEVESSVRRLAALGSELGAPGLPEDLPFSDDLSERSFQFGVLAPLGALDRQSVLEADGVDARLDLLLRLLDEQREVLLGRLSMGDR